MKYTVSINQAKRSITVTLADGTKGTARCCPTDRFDLTVGTESALERAKVAKTNAEKAKAATKPMSARELARELEKVLPKGQIIVAVGGGDNCLTEQGKKWLATLAGVSTKCHCPCRDCDDDNDDYGSGYDDGYADGYADAKAEYENETDNEAALDLIREVLADAGII